MQDIHVWQPSQRDFEFLRLLLDAANDHVSYKSLLLIAGRCGFDIEITHDTVLKFANRDSKTMNMTCLTCPVSSDQA